MSRQDIASYITYNKGGYVVGRNQRINDYIDSLQLSEEDYKTLGYEGTPEEVRN
jgi:hypothetical protein